MSEQRVGRQSFILMALADEDQRDEVDRTPWLALQTFIAASDPRVTIPFPKQLVAMIPPVAVRLRRDVKLLLNLIRTHALLHQATRERDEQGRIVATLADYAAIHELVAEAMAEGARASVRATMRETVEAVESLALFDGSASVTQVARRLQLDVAAASRRYTSAAKAGYIVNQETRPRQMARYVPGEPLPDEQPLLPSPELLAQHLSVAAPADGDCMFDDQMEGKYPPPPPAHSERRRIVV